MGWEILFTRTGKVLGSALFSQKPADQLKLESLLNEVDAEQVTSISLDPTVILAT